MAMSASMRTVLASKIRSMSRQSSRARARENWCQIVRSESDRNSMPSGSGTSDITPAKPWTAAVVLDLSVRFFDSLLCAF